MISEAPVVALVKSNMMNQWIDNLTLNLPYRHQLLPQIHYNKNNI